MAQLSCVRLGGTIVIVPPSSPRRRYVGSCSPSPLLVYPPTLLLLSGNNLQISLTVSLLHQFIDIKNHTIENLKYYKNAHTHKTNKIYTHKRVCRRKHLLKGSISLRGSGLYLSLSILEDAGYLTPPMRRQIWVVYKRMNQLPLSPSRS